MPTPTASGRLRRTFAAGHAGTARSGVRGWSATSSPGARLWLLFNPIRPQSSTRCPGRPRSSSWRRAGDMGDRHPRVSRAPPLPRRAADRRRLPLRLLGGRGGPLYHGSGGSGWRTSVSCATPLSPAPATSAEACGGGRCARRPRGRTRSSGGERRAPAAGARKVSSCRRNASGEILRIPPRRPAPPRPRGRAG